MGDNVREVRPSGRIDSATGPAFERDILQQIDGGHYERKGGRNRPILRVESPGGGQSRARAQTDCA